MAKQLYTLSLDSIKLLTGLIRDLASVSEGIDNLHLADDKTFSNIYIKNLVDKCLQDANAEAQKLVGALTHLTCEETTVQPTLDNSEINVIYLYSADGNAPYQQYLKISNTKLVDLGSTSISLTDYIKAADVAKDYATKTELKAVTDKIGTTTLTTTAQTLTGSIEEVKGIAEQGALLTVTKTQYDQLVAGGTVNIDGKDYTYDSNTYYVVKDDSDTIVTTTTISSSSTDSEVPTAKAVNDKITNLQAKVSSNGAVCLGYIPPNGASVRFNVTGLFLVICAPSNSIVIMNMYTTDGVLVKEVADTNNGFFTITMISDRLFEIKNNVGWSVSYTIIGCDVGIVE